LDVDFNISLGGKGPSPGTGHEEGPSIRGPGPGHCAAGVHATAGSGTFAGADAGASAGMGTEEPEGPPVCRGSWEGGEAHPRRDVWEEVEAAVIQRAEL
jgi:hypothetical protein